GQVRKKAPNPSKQKYTWYLLAILLITFIANSPILQNGFTNWDDPNYIIDNPLIRDFSIENIKQIFTEVYFANYQPLHILSYLIEFQFFELDPKGYHVVSLLMHLLATALVYLLLKVLSANAILSLIGALWFGVHPMHVESVAWASERKDLLYSIFFFAALITYIKYIQLKHIKWFYYTMLFFVLSVFSKAMAVSLVPILVAADILYKRKFNLKLIIEKVPFVVLSIIMGLVSVNASKEAESISTNSIYTFTDRIFFACHNLLQYVAKLIVPYNQSAYYSYPVKDTGIPLEYYIALPIVLCIAAFTIYSINKNRKIFFAITFFVMSLFLVLMLLPVGPTIFSERYSYISSVGLFFLFIVIIEKLLANPTTKQIRIKILSGFALVYLLFLSYQCFERSKVWKDSFTLWEDVLEKQPLSAHAYNNLGDAYYKQQNNQMAIESFTKSLEISDDDALAYYNRANAYANSGSFPQAIKDLDKSIELDPDSYEAFNKRGAAHAISGYTGKAFNDFNKAIELNPGFSEVYYNMGVSTLNLGNQQKACEYFTQGAQLKHTESLRAYNDLCFNKY
ncbi:MAG: tetratricopeptide repeat protein, partial [Bacteroidia bacterium]|nr:tetratricopeptide repeat protein [Bacteroidia bacterium]